MPEYEVLSCKMCGGSSLKYEINTGAYICTYCNSTYIRTVENEQNSQKKIDNAELHFHVFREKYKAREFYEEASILNPHDFRCWWGLAKVETDNFTNTHISSSTLKSAEEYVVKANKVAPVVIKEQLDSVFQRYKTEVLKHIEEKSDEYKQEIDELSKKLIEIECSINEICAQKQNLYSERDNLKKRISRMSFDSSIGSIVCTMIISGIVCYLLCKVLFIDTHWDLSTWIVGGPAIIALGICVVSIIRILVIIYKSVMKSSLEYQKTDIDKRIQNVLSQENDLIKQKKEIQNSISTLKQTKNNL